MKHFVLSLLISVCFIACHSKTKNILENTALSANADADYIGTWTLSEVSSRGYKGAPQNGRTQSYQFNPDGTFVNTSTRNGKTKTLSGKYELLDNHKIYGSTSHSSTKRIIQLNYDQKVTFHNCFPEYKTIQVLSLNTENILTNMLPGTCDGQILKYSKN